MTKRKINPENSRKKVVEAEASERMPAVNNAAPAVELLREALEKVVENERRRVRSELITINMVVLVVLLVIVGAFLYIACKFMNRVENDRSIGEVALMSAIERIRAETSPTNQARMAELRRLLETTVNKWEPAPAIQQPPVLTKKVVTATPPTLPAPLENRPESEPVIVETAVASSTAMPAQPTEPSNTPLPTREPGFDTRIADLDSENEAIELLMDSEDPGVRSVIQEMIADRDRELAKLRKKLEQNHAMIVDKNRPPPTPSTPTPQREPETSSATPSKHISVEAKGTRLRIPIPLPQ